MGESILRRGRSVRDLTPDARVFILLHGRGGHPADMDEAGDQLARATDAVLIPEASSGMWYPFSAYSPISQNEPMLTQSLDRVQAIVAHLERSGVQKQQIVLAGFSQGACLVAQYLLRDPGQYAAALIFSGCLLGGEDELKAQLGSLEQTPVVFSGSRFDPYIRWARAEASATLLRSMGADTILHGYEAATHTITPAEYVTARKVLYKQRR